MKRCLGLTFGEYQQGAEEDDLPLISATTPSAAATSFVVALPTGYSWYDLRFNLGRSVGAGGLVQVALSLDGVSYGTAQDASRQTGSDVVTSSFVGIAVHTSLSRAFATDQTVGADAIGAKVLGRATHVKLTILDGDTFTGTGKVWLHGLAS